MKRTKWNADNTDQADLRGFFKSEFSYYFEQSEK
jgi:hypothetical protein